MGEHDARVQLQEGFGRMANSSRRCALPNVRRASEVRRLLPIALLHRWGDHKATSAETAFRASQSSRQVEAQLNPCQSVYVMIKDLGHREARRSYELVCQKGERG